MKALKWVVFDFDGTISDSNEAALATFNSMSNKFGYRQVTHEQMPALRNKTSREVLKTVGISLLKLPFVVREARLRFEARIDSLQPYQGIQPSLIELKQRGLRLGIITSNSNVNVKRFLQKNELDVFDFVHSGASIFGKARIIKSLMKKWKIMASEAVYVGDETRDIDAAKSAGIRIVSVSWGFNTKEVLQNQGPDFLIDHPFELPKILLH
jgi:phosphoglycolate phosphatase